MDPKCPHCAEDIIQWGKRCGKCGKELPLEDFFEDLILGLKARRDMRIGQLSIIECEVFNISHFSVGNVEVSLSGPCFAQKSTCSARVKIKARSSERLGLQVEIAKWGQSYLNISISALVEEKMPVCYKGQIKVETAPVEGDSGPVHVHFEGKFIGNDFGGIHVHRPEGQGDAGSEWVEVPLKRDEEAERDWQKQLEAQWLEACPYCSAMVNMKGDICDYCAASLPAWLAKRREQLDDSTEPLPPLKYLELKVPSLDNRVFRFLLDKKITWGRHSENDVYILFYDEEGRPDAKKSKGISNYAGRIDIQDGRAVLVNKNRFVTQFKKKHAEDEDVEEFDQHEKKELKQEGTLTMSGLASLDIRPFTTKRQQSEGQRARDPQELQEDDSARQSSCFIWPEKNVEAIRICRADSPSNIEHILLEHSASIGSGENCCVRIAKSGIEKHHARLIYYDKSIWFENCTNTPIRFETDKPTKFLENDAIMKINTDCTVKIGYMEAHLRLR